MHLAIYIFIMPAMLLFYLSYRPSQRRIGPRMFDEEVAGSHRRLHRLRRLRRNGTYINHTEMHQWYSKCVRKEANHHVILLLIRESGRRAPVTKTVFVRLYLTPCSIAHMHFSSVWLFSTRVTQQSHSLRNPPHNGKYLILMLSPYERHKSSHKRSEVNHRSHFNTNLPW